MALQLLKVRDAMRTASHDHRREDPLLRAADRTTPREGPLRYLLYSHDSWGLGHLRRNLNLAGTLTAGDPEASVLLVTGSPCATFFECPPGVELIKLPSVTKDESGLYQSRRLPLSLEATVELRSRILQSAYESFRPDAVLVDHQVTGLGGELLDVLRMARADGVPTTLGLRDIIDEPDTVAREWGNDEARWALREGYDRVCVYGSPEIFDCRVEYPFPPELAQRVEFVGYVVREFPRHSRRALPSLRPQILVTIGGGEDGENRLECVVEALEQERLDVDVVLVGGPMLDPRAARKLKRRARLLPNVQVHRFHADLPRLLAESDLVICMAGYNTCAELLYSGRRAIFLPRVFPRREQAIRAACLARAGAGVSLEEPTPEGIAEAIREALDDASPAISPLHASVPLDGAARLASILREQATSRRAVRGTTPTARHPEATPNGREEARVAQGTEELTR